jgi:hypothetical protein
MKQEILIIAPVYDIHENVRCLLSGANIWHVINGRIDDIEFVSLQLSVSV